VTTLKKFDFLARPRDHGKSQLIADLVTQQTAAVRAATMTMPADLLAYTRQIERALAREYSPSVLTEYLAAEEAKKAAARKAYLETPEGIVEQVAEALGPPKSKPKHDDMLDAFRYCFGVKVLKPENVVHVSNI
jgi:hypothetical protein